MKWIGFPNLHGSFYCLNLMNLCFRVGYLLLMPVSLVLLYRALNIKRWSLDKLQTAMHWWWIEFRLVRHYSASPAARQGPQVWVYLDWLKKTNSRAALHQTISLFRVPTTVRLILVRRDWYFCRIIPIRAEALYTLYGNFSMINSLAVEVNLNIRKPVTAPHHRDMWFNVFNKERLQ